MLDVTLSKKLITLFSTVGFLLNVFAGYLPTWGVSCNTLQTGDEICDRLGLYQWCRATDGLNDCAWFDPATIHKPQRNKNYYYAAQFFMMVCVFSGCVYVFLDLLERILAFTRQKHVELVTPENRRALFYGSVGVEFLTGLITMSIWAHQSGTHEHNLDGYGKIFFKTGNSFNASIVAWIFCLIAMGLRFVLIDRPGLAGSSSSRSTAGFSSGAPASSSAGGSTFNDL